MAEIPQRLLEVLTDTTLRRLRRRSELVERCCRLASERSVHRLRVETRRLLAALDLLARSLPADVVTEGCRALRKQLKRTSRLRDFQVFRRLVAAQLESHPELEEFLRHLRSSGTVRARRVRNRLVRRKAARRIAALGVALAAVIAEQLPALPAEVERTLRLARLRVLRQRAARASDPASLHRLRVALKQYRYLHEVVRSFLPPSTAVLLKAWRKWQAQLGAIHDAGLLNAEWRRFAARCESTPKLITAGRALARNRRTLLRRYRPLPTTLLPRPTLLVTNP